MGPGHVTLFASFLVVILSGLTKAQVKNGFELNNSTIPAHEIKHGGPPRDGIPSIDQPKFISVDEAIFIKPDDLVIGLRVNGIFRAYPIKILNWHEVVNDEIGGLPIVITYCPLCRSAIVFKSSIRNRILSFGVSGLLYNSDVLLYDRQTESLWSQLKTAAVTGKYSGTSLEMIASETTTWREWKAKYPETQVLSEETGFIRDYRSSPYDLYRLSDRLMFPVRERSEELPTKELVLGVKWDEIFIAFPFKELKRSKGKLIYKSLTVRYNQSGKSAVAYDQVGKVVPSVTLYWFAWYAFHPNTLVYKK